MFVYLRFNKLQFPGFGEGAEAAPDKYDKYLGEYADLSKNMVVKVFVQGGNLAVDIPQKVVLAMNDPDEDGLWYCKLSNQIYFTFEKDNAGKVVEMQLHQIIPMPGKSGPEKADSSVPEKFRSYLGKYSFAALQVEFTVLYKDGSLAVDDPAEKKIIKLKLPNEKGRWVDEFNKNAIFFELDAQGNVKSMNIDSIAKFRR